MDVEKEEYKKQRLIITIMVLIVLLFSTITLIFFVNRKIKVKKEPKQEQEKIEQETIEQEEQEEEKKQPEETKIKEETKTPVQDCGEVDFKTNIFNIVHYLSGGLILKEDCNYILLTQESFNSNKYRVDRFIRMTDYTIDSKIALALRITPSNEEIEYKLLSENVKAEKSKISELNGSPAPTDDTKIHSKSFEKVKKVYKTVFGEELEEPEDGWNRFILYSIKYYYDKKNHSFVDVTPGASAAGYGVDFVYINRVEYIDDYAYVYLNVGHTEGDDNAYNGYSTEEIVEANIDYKTYKIDETNYKKFKEYKYTFKKSSEGNYYFVSVE